MRSVLFPLALTLVVGCDQPASPSKTSNAVIEVRNPVDVPYPPPGAGYHDFFFTLAETGGISGATIQSLTTAVSGDTSRADIGCWVRPMRVAAGSTLDLTPAVLGYCSPSLAVPTSESSVSLQVAYIDDAGRLGSIQTSIPISR
jgi:hypothetical protein